MIYAPLPFSAVSRVSGLVFMFLAAGLFFGSKEGVGSRYHVLCSRTRFRQYRGRRVPFFCFALSDSFSAVPRATGLVCTFCAPGLIFGGIGSVRSRFSCFVRPDSFSAVPRASGPVFMICALGLIFGGIGGVESRFSYIV
jgi:hypothetical protein